ncbi:MAG: AMP-binding protein [Blastocatellia bacterium]|nr:AMP-binding protein [Blastocatellia bacterium]
MRTRPLQREIDRQPATGYRLPATDNRQPTTDYRLPTTDYRLPTTMLTFSHQLIASAERRPRKVAMTLLSAGEARDVTFGEMAARTRSIAFRLGREGVQPGDRVAIIGENHPNWAIAYFGTLHCGAVAVPLDPAASLDALANFLTGSEAKLAFVSFESLRKFRAVCERMGRRIPAVLLNDEASSPTSEDGAARFEEWARTPPPPEFAAAPPLASLEKVAVMMYTSGTTGFPKAVPLTHRNIQAETGAVQEAMRVSEDEVILGLLPLFHVYSQIVTLWLSPLIGARVVYLTELNSAQIERGLKAAGVTALIGVPRVWYLFHKKVFDAVRARSTVVRSLFRALLRMNGWLRDGLGINLGRLFFRQVHEGFGGRLRLAVSAGASFDADVARDFHRLGFTLLQGYGLTETCGAATVTRFEDNLIGSVGTPLDGVEVKIDEPNGEGIGEVLIRGPIVTPGYDRNPEANRDAFTPDNWFRTGDLGRLDARNHLFIVGRKKDVIKLPSGKNVFPEDVEAHYGQSPLVSEICVVGVHDAAVGVARAEKLLGVVVPDFEYLKANHIANAREAIRFALDTLGRDLPEYQRLREYVVRAEPLPRTTTRKIQRFAVLRQIETAGIAEGAGREADRFPFTAEDRNLLDSPTGRAVTAMLLHHAPRETAPHPRMNLELDLGLDSLARAECIVGLEQRLGITLDPQETSAALTVGELIGLVERQTHGRLPAAGRSLAGEDWRDILTTASLDTPDLAPILQPKPMIVWIAYALLRVIYATARVFLRMEVEGREALTATPRPYLICPNHQSYLDPILISSTYSPGVLRHIFHVGATEYFAGPFMQRLARTLNIVPVDPDLNLIRAMRAGAGGLRAGRILNIYPEGQRSFDGRLHEFKEGAAILASELQLPIVPVAIDGAWRVWPRGSRRLHPARVKIRFGAPIHPAADVPATLDAEARHQALTDLLKTRIQQMLDEMRGEEGESAAG